MKIVAFSDWRVQPFKPLVDKIQSIKPDYTVYAGDDTLRLADYSINSLKKILNAIDTHDINIGYGRDEDFRTEFQTLKQFKKRIEREIQVILTQPGEIGFHRRHPPSNYVSNNPIWIGPPPRKRGPCLYYNRHIGNWIDDIAISTKYGLGAVVGNDCQYVEKFRLTRKRVNDLHSNPTIIDNVAFIGLEGSSGNIGIILYTEEEARIHLEKQWEFVTNHEPDIVVLVTHAPPKGILDLSRRFGINNIGSQAVKEFIENHEVDLVICGHSHINGGRIKEIDDECTVLNIASHDYENAPGLVATIDINVGKKPQIEIQRLFDFESVLRAIHGIGSKRAQYLSEMGFASLEDIALKNRAKMLRLHGIGIRTTNKWILESRALRRGMAYRIADARWNRLNPDNALIYDIETDSFQKYVWCIGAWNGYEEEFVQFFQKKNESRLIRRFFRYVKKHSDLRPVTFSATDFDRRVILEVAKRHKIKHPLSLKREIDLGALVVHRTVGTPKGGLKQLGPFFGYEWTDSSIDGAIVGMEYSNYLHNGIELDWNKYLEYNKDDVMATVYVLNKLLKLKCKNL